MTGASLENLSIKKSPCFRKKTGSAGFLCVCLEGVRRVCVNRHLTGAVV
mgnify:FL=1